MEESFQLPVFNPPVSGEPLRALESLTLKSPEKLNYAQVLHAYIAFHGTAMKRGVCCWLVTVPRAEAPHPLCLVLLL